VKSAQQKQRKLFALLHGTRNQKGKSFKTNEKNYKLKKKKNLLHVYSKRKFRKNEN